MNHKGEKPSFSLWFTRNLETFTIFTRKILNKVNYVWFAIAIHCPITYFRHVFFLNKTLKRNNSTVQYKSNFYNLNLQTSHVTSNTLISIGLLNAKTNQPSFIRAIDQEPLIPNKVIRHLLGAHPILP